MADPVIVPSGLSFDRPFIEACRDFSFPPPSAPNLDFSSPNFLLIPNVALKSAILNWSSRSSLPPPVAASPAAARDLVSALISSSSSSTTTLLSPESTKSSNSDTNSCELEETEDPLVEEIVSGPKHPQISVREFALINLRHSSRERQTALCTPKLLSSLLPFLLSRNPSLQSNAVASLVNLSIEPSNKIKIVRSGAVPPLVDVLKNAGDPDARDHAAGAVFSLALKEENRLAIGVLGAVPPLVHLFRRRRLQTAFCPAVSPHRSLPPPLRLPRGWGPPSVGPAASPARPLYASPETEEGTALSALTGRKEVGRRRLEDPDPFVDWVSLRRGEKDRREKSERRTRPAAKTWNTAEEGRR